MLFLSIAKCFVRLIYGENKRNGVALGNGVAAATCNTKKKTHGISLNCENNVQE